MLRLPADPDLQRTVAGWFAAARARPGVLPDDCLPVATRLVRGVGVAALPDGDRAFVKVMAFPRPKDRLRYVHRALPAVHEARLLERLGAALPGLAVPEVLGALAERRGGLPWLSVLVTRDLGPSASPPGFVDCTRVAARLADVGCWHRDFHPGNVLRLADGRLGVLDLQSATWRGRPLVRREREAMAIKMLSSATGEADATALVAAGLVDDRRLAAIEASAALQVDVDRGRRIRRCLRTSTEFVVRRRWDGVLYARRGCDAGDAVPVGVRGLALWLGDRALEIDEGRPPSLCGLFRSAWWRPGGDCVYVRRQEAPVDFGAIEPVLLKGHRTAVAGRRPAHRAMRVPATGSRRAIDPGSGSGREAGR